jgi:uncharacterized integral membrane protein (TIGR00697 family)
MDNLRIIEIITSNRKGLLVKVQEIGKKNYFIRSVSDIIKDKSTLSQFSKSDIAQLAVSFGLTKKSDNTIKFHTKTIKLSEKYLMFLCMLYTSLLIISNTIGSKIANVWTIDIPSVLILFPMTYIIDDIITEIYGYNISRKLIWFGLLVNILTVCIINVVSILPSSNLWKFQGSFENIFSSSTRIFIASSLGYLVGEFLNSFILAKLKILTNGKHLWFRAIFSSLFGVTIDSVLFCTISFYQIVPSEIITKMIIFQIIFKIIYEIILLPFTYYLINLIKNKEGLDHYDLNTNFNPFSLIKYKKND